MEKQARLVKVHNNLFVSTVWAIPTNYSSETGNTVILAHGAGTDIDHEFMTDFQKRITKEGNMTILFNFPYKESQRSFPDSLPLLKKTLRSVIKAFQNSQLSSERLFIGGKSMGGKIASYVADSREYLKGLIFLGYPLHPPGYPHRLRSSHWQDIVHPALFIQGTRDKFCQLDLLKQELSKWGGKTTLHIVEGGDHSFKTLKKIARTQQDIRHEISKVISTWLNKI